MTLILPDDLVARLKETVVSGEYASIDQALEDAVRSFLEKKRESARLTQLLQEGLDDFDNGDYIDGETAFRELFEHSRKMREKYGDRLPPQSARER